METISSFHLKRISNEKNFNNTLLRTLKKLSYLSFEFPIKYGITTQIIVGAADEKDKEILNFSYSLYKNFRLKRVYYSGFIPVINTPFENKKPCSEKRQFRLYQADILIRKYKFLPSEILFDKNGNLFLNKDPKVLWAEKNESFYPIEINKGDFYQLIRIPGIGLKTAKKILEIRKNTKITSENILKKIGIPLKKVAPYILINGKKIKKLENDIGVEESNSTIFDDVV
ncbi:MAG: hypothetical protein NZ891_00765, partial [bacterium]|nr:hypothetical protein [bacterium]MDW8163264.1 hypothetical protein [Candidatus Omnitrophota bacterium]